MNPIPLGLLLIACGALFFWQGRMWQERATGPRVSKFWQLLPTGIRRLWRASEGPLMVGPLPTQLWGVAALVVGVLIVVGLIPSGQPAALALFVVLVPGTIAMGIATLLTRFFRSPEGPDGEQIAGAGTPKH